MAHTLGPWEADRCTDGNGGHYYQIDAPTPAGINPGFPYTVADTLNRHHCVSPEEDAANARLIAAAPDLLAALHAIVEAIGDEPGDTNPLYRPWKIATDALKRPAGNDCTHTSAYHKQEMRCAICGKNPLAAEEGEA